MTHTELHQQTPLFESLQMSATAGKRVLLKMDCYQPGGSFKIRGIGRLCTEHVEAGTEHLVCSSGGNAGLAVAYSARQLGVAATVVVPETTSEEVRHRIGLEGANVIVHGEVWDVADVFANKLSKEVNGAYIHPFDHPTTWKGHASMIEEAVRQCEQRPDTLIVSVGGGGLLCGIMEGLEQCGWEDVQVIAVETKGADSLATAVASGELVTLDRIASIATTLGARRVASKAFEYATTRDVMPWVVSDAAAVEACLKFSEDHKVLVEPSCGASLSLVYDRASVLDEAQTILVIVCGGSGVTIDKLLAWRDSLS
jgi:L-serine/L-threonine ammonia-lyase